MLLCLILATYYIMRPLISKHFEMRPQQTSPYLLISIIVGGFIIIGSLGVYFVTNNTQITHQFVPNSVTQNSNVAQSLSLDVLVQDLSFEERQSLILSMVQNLENKLVNMPSDAEGWKMLARSYVVLGRIEQADEAFEKAYLLNAIEINDIIAHGRLLRTHQKGIESLRTFELMERILSKQVNHFEARLFYSIGLIAFDKNKALGYKNITELLDELSNDPVRQEDMQTAINKLLVAHQEKIISK